jgi:3-oxoacyl-[acyl-carrier protein] reductase
MSPVTQAPFQAHSGVLTGQVALVTGASRGIGAAIAQSLAQAGAQVVGTATTVQGAQAIQEALSVYPGCEGQVLNVNDREQAAQCVESLVQRKGRLDVLVNNAGITRDTLAMRMKDEDFDAVIDTNLAAVFRLSRSAMKPMMKARRGRLIHITSVIGQMGNPGQANYAAAKAGVAGMTRALAQELGSRGITVNCVAPGFIETDMTAQLTPAHQQALIERIPLGRLGQAQDVAAVVVFLASPESGYITGQEIQVNGGMYM